MLRVIIKSKLTYKVIDDLTTKNIIKSWYNCSYTWCIQILYSRLFVYSL